ncbi:hypothetical protein E2C01_084441 [Portunus trituberculatus]|uniref:Uncharacterized protein n=1 Tax=Portunus trituberculatus TaxID=210409 RepID=A0A5B7IY99_PORTR|nr:hypothetical protein [Portunus trituberculatus]
MQGAQLMHLQGRRLSYLQIDLVYAANLDRVREAEDYPEHSLVHHSLGEGCSGGESWVDGGR